MIVTMHSSTKWVVLFNSILFIWGYIVEANPIFVITIILYIFMMFYCWAEIESRSLFFAFGVDFGIFLLGREFLQVFFKYEVEGYDLKTNNHTYITLLLSLIGLWSTYFIVEYIRDRKKNRVIDHGVIVNYNSENYSFTISVRQWSQIFLWISAPIAIIYRIIVAVGDSAVSEGNTIFYITGRLENCLPVFMGIYFSTLPDKKEVKSVFMMYLIYLGISLSGGNRGTFLLGLLYIFVIVVYMQSAKPDEVWFKREYIWLLIAVVPVIAILGSFYDNIRWEGTIGNNSLFQEFVDFFYDQGTTITAVKHAYEFADRLPKQHYLLEFIHSGVLARIFRITVYHGNSVQHALYGASMVHSLSYVVMGPQYLLGRGTGTSYIIELFYDLGYIGVFVGNVIYGVLLYLIRDINVSLLKRSFVFVLMSKLLWAPRGSCTGFLAFFFAPTTLVAFILVWGLATITNSSR